MTIKATIILLTVAAVWALHMISSNILASDCETVAASLEYLQFLPLSVPKTSLGRRIIEKSFHESFADLVETCGILNETDSLEKCLRTLYQRRKEPGTVYNEKWPWWFQTMIRDAKTRSSGLFGAWHILQFSDPLMQLCVYEKGGTKMWRHVHCQALANRENTTDVDITNCFKRQGALATKNVQKSVFLRDPLERFLSGFLDKCTTKNRIEQSHCQPNIIFSSNPTDYVADFLTETKKLFEVYVDTLPVRGRIKCFPSTSFVVHVLIALSLFIPAEMGSSLSAPITAMWRAVSKNRKI